MRTSLFRGSIRKGLVLVLFFSIAIPFLVRDEASAQRRLAPDNKEQIRLSFSPIVKKVAPAVVNVYVRRKVRREAFSPFANDPFFRRFFGENFGIPRERVQSSLGSGVIVSDTGIVVTNFHVIKGGTNDGIKVALNDKREFTARVLLQDERTDLAVLKIDDPDSPFPYVEIEDSDSLEVGDLVLAIGNPFGVGQTVTSGIVSALARTQVGISDYQFFIQTDAAINPGNSGGALVDVNGRLVGINTAIFSRSGGSHGIGFAIPSNMARLVIASATKGNRVKRPWLGAKLQTVTSDLADSLGLDRPIGALITNLSDESPLQLAGLRVGDVLLQIEDVRVDNPQSFVYRFSTQEIGKTVNVEFVRSRRVRKASIELFEAPEIPKRDIRLLSGQSPFAGGQFANLSPALAEELSLDATSGVIMLDAERNSAARSVGLKRGDIILEINGTKIKNTRALQRITNRRERAWRFSIQRGKRILSTTIRG